MAGVCSLRIVDDLILHTVLRVPLQKFAPSIKFRSEYRTAMGALKQIIVVQLVVLFVCVRQTCSARDLDLTLLGRVPGIKGVWNRSAYPATQFRNDSVVEYFDIWPENRNATHVRFDYYCEDPADGNLSLRNFTYSRGEGVLDPRPYFDLGIVESYQPYWKHWLFWKVDTKRLSYPINCEYNDLHRLYAYRFWTLTMKNGCAAAAVVQSMVQFLVAVAVSFMWGVTFCKRTNKQRLLLLKSWFWNLQWGDFFSEVIHLGLLVLVGYCMMEAISHGDLHIWRPTVMYNTGVIYSYLTVFAVLSSVFRQIAYCWMDHEKLVDYESRRKAHGKLSMQADIWFSLQDISDDWRWQRVFGQLGVLVLMGTYLSFVEDASGGGMDQMAGLGLAATVVACIWSFGVTGVVLFRSVLHILAQTFPAFALFAFGRVSSGVSEEESDSKESDVGMLHCIECGHRLGASARVQ